MAGSQVENKFSRHSWQYYVGISAKLQEPVSAMAWEVEKQVEIYIYALLSKDNSCVQHSCQISHLMTKQTFSRLSLTLNYFKNMLWPQ